MGFCNSPRGRRTPPGTSRYPTRAKAAAMAPVWFRLCPFRSPLLRASRLISFPRPTKMFCFGRFPLRPHDRAGWWASTAHRVSPFGHPGLTGSCASARLFAALHALRRLREPRHPSRALTNLHTGGRGGTGRILLTSSLLWRWWDSNPRPPACKAGALPAELHPLFKGAPNMGLPGLEPGTLPLSGARSNQLS